MTSTIPTRRDRSSVGALVRHWRDLQRLSPLELSLEADVSQRHLSYVETGKSRPSRQLLLHLASVLDVPLRDRNALLSAGGYAAVYPQTHWDDDAMAAAAGNAMRLLVHPDGLRSAITNFDVVGGHLADRIAREAAAYPDDDQLAALASELTDPIGDVPRTDPDVPLPMVIDSHLQAGDLEVGLLSMLASVGGAHDVTCPSWWSNCSTPPTPPRRPRSRPSPPDRAGHRSRYPYCSSMLVRTAERARSGDVAPSRT